MNQILLHKEVVNLDFFYYYHFMPIRIDTFYKAGVHSIFKLYQAVQTSGKVKSKKGQISVAIHFLSWPLIHLSEEMFVDIFLYVFSIFFLHLLCVLQWLVLSNHCKKTLVQIPPGSYSECFFFVCAWFSPVLASCHGTKTLFLG